MFCGRFAEPRELEFVLDTSGSISGATASIPCSYQGDMLTLFQVDYTLTATGFYMYAGGAVGGVSPIGSAYLQSDLFLPTGLLVPATGASAPVLSLKILGCRTYALASGLWETVVDGIEWRVDGSLEWSMGAGSWTSAIALTAASVPLLGMYPLITAGVGIPETAATSATGGVPTGDISFSGTCDAYGSWGWGTELVDGTASAIGTTTRTSEVIAVNDFYADGVQLAPSWATGIVRMEPDTRSLPLRGGFPACDRLDTDATVTVAPPPPPGDPDLNGTVGGDTLVPVLPELSQFLGIAGDTVSTAEEPFTYTVPRPFFNLHEVETIHPGKIVTELHGSRFAFPPAPVGSGVQWPYLDHADASVRYCNTWQHPHWSFGDWFPAESADTSVKWKLAGSDVDPIDYWLPNRQQHLKHPALPGTDDLGKRNYLVSSPIDQNGLTGLVQAALGCPSWWGTSQFEVLDLSDAPTSFDLDERTEDRWTFRGDGSIGDTGTGTIDASGITLDAPGTTIDFALGSYTVWPYMALRRCNRLTLPAITDANVSKVEAFLIGADGGSVKIGEVEAGDPDTTLLIPRGTSTKHGGSWGHDMGAGWGTDTFGPSYDPGGDVSPAIASDPELSGGYPFIQFGAGERVRFVLHPVSPGDVSMEWPTFTAPDWADIMSYADAAGFRTLLGPDAPAIRFGTGNHYDPMLDALINPPNGEPVIDRARELGDGYAWANLWIYGKAWDEDLSTNLGALYESGVEWTLEKHFWRDPFDGARVTHSFLAQGQSGPVICLVNSYRATPPLGMFPHKERTKASNWKADGAYCMYSYLLSPSKRHHITTTTPRLENPPSTDVLTDTELAPDGWDVRSHALVTDGDEVYDWGAVSFGKEWALVRPWRGFIWFPGIVETLGRVLALLSRDDGRLFRIVSKPSNIAIGATSARDYSEWLDRDIDGEATDADIERSSQDSIVTALVIDGELELRLEKSEGINAPTTTMIEGPATAAALASYGDGTIVVYRVDGGVVKATFRNVNDLSLISGPTDTNLTGLDDDARIDAEDVSLKGNKPGIVLLVGHSGGTNSYLSLDGKTFS